MSIFDINKYLSNKPSHKSVRDGRIVKEGMMLGRAHVCKQDNVRSGRLRGESASSSYRRQVTGDYINKGAATVIVDSLSS